jgi:hypothetical protein
MSLPEPGVTGAWWYGVGFLLWLVGATLVGHLSWM